MDVYGGGIGAGARRLRAELGALLAGLGLPHRDLGRASELATVWGDGTGEAVHVQDEQVEVLFDGYLHHHGAASLAEFLPELARRVVTGRRVLEGRESGVFNLVVLDKRTGDLHLASDPGALLPLIHGRSDDGYLFASHLYLAARALDRGPDLMGVACKVALGYSIGSRTSFQGLERLNPGELVTYRAATGQVERTYPEVYWSEHLEPGPDLIEEIWDALVGAVRPVVDDGRSVGVMLSEGFDSRLVAGVLQHLGADLHTFTHATEGTKGTAIVEELSRRLGSQHTFDLLEQGFPADLDELRAQMLLADNLHVPYWGAGSAHFRDRGVDAATTGYALDTTLGAHAFSRPGASTRRRVVERYREIVRQDLGRIDDAQIEALADDLLTESTRIDVSWAARRVRRFLADDVAEEVVPHVEGISDEIAAEHQRIRASGAGRASQVLQRYFLENRGRKYSFGQELTLRVNRPVVVPCYEPAFMRLMTSVPPRLRTHHRAYLRLLRTHLPDLARIQSGAHALPPTYPRLALETSRFAWKAYENRILTEFLESKGDRSVEQLRMVLFTEKNARQAPRFALEDVIDRGSGPVNRESMQITVDKIRRYEIRVFLPALYLGLELTEIFDEL